MGLKKFLTGTAAVPLIILVVLLIIYFLFLPPILKYIIENQGEKQPGNLCNKMYRLEYLQQTFH